MAVFFGSSQNDVIRRHLFSGPRIETFLAARVQSMAKAVADIPEGQLNSLEVDSFLDAIRTRFGVVLPTLRKDDLSQDDEGEVSVDIRGHADYIVLPGRPTTVPGRRVALFVPFDGDAAVFEHDPPGSSGVQPLGVVRGNELVHYVEYPGTKAPDIKARADKFVDDVVRWTAIAKTAVEDHNRDVVARARQLLADRMSRAAAAASALQKSGVPQRKKDSDKRDIFESIRRRPAPVLRNDSGPIKLEPALVDATYDHILSVLGDAGRNMEQSPGAFETVDEEGRRQFLRATLNTHYAGQASAEAFNYKGKTDILVNHEGRSLFVCECKFWTGQKGFSDTIDQLFRYATWRDTKLAIVMFVREKGLTGILEKATDSLRHHAQHLSPVATSEETELRSIMSWPGDVERKLTLHVLFVHTPAETTG